MNANNSRCNWKALESTVFLLNRSALKGPIQNECQNKTVEFPRFIKTLCLLGVALVNRPSHNMNASVTYVEVVSNANFNTAVLAIASPTAILHLVGLFVLFRIKVPQFNQIKIMINLAFTELIFCLNVIVYFTVVKIVDKDWHTLRHMKTLHLIVNNSCVVANRLVMLYLVGDRFLDINLHMKYPIYFTKKRVMTVLFCCWVVGGSFGLIQGTLVALQHYSNRDSYVISNSISLTLDSAIAVSAIATYVYFYSKVGEMNRRDNARRKGNQKRINIKHSFKFLVPFIMIVTYIIFNVSATVIWQVTSLHGESNKKLTDILFQVAWIVELVGFLCDAILYVLLQRNVRTTLISKLSMKRPLSTRRRGIESAVRLVLTTVAIDKNENTIGSKSNPVRRPKILFLILPDKIVNLHLTFKNKLKRGNSRHLLLTTWAIFCLSNACKTETCIRDPIFQYRFSL